MNKLFLKLKAYRTKKQKARDEWQRIIKALEKHIEESEPVSIARF
jgi:hypothetical protein